MKYSEIIRTAVTNLKGNRTRSVLTISGIGVGIGAIVFLVSLGNGLQEVTTKKIGSIGALTTLDVGSAKKANFKLDKPTLDEIAKIQGVEKVSPLLSTGAKAEFSDAKTDVVINAIEDEFFALEGTRVNYGGLFANTKEDIVVSSAVAKALKQEPQNLVNQSVKLKVSLPTEGGKTFTEKELTYKVLGVFVDDSSAFIYIPLGSIQADLPSSVVYNSAKVKMISKETIGPARAKIEEMGFTVTTIADTISQIEKTFQIIQIVLSLFGAIALLVAAIGMFNTMTIALLERTRDIGIMKSIGVRNRDIYRMFLTESSLIAFLGGIVGVCGGFIISKGINFGINILAKSVGGEPQNLFVTPLWFAGVIMVFSMLVGLATGFYPSRRAAGINPLDALRYE